tara:strand:+ start:1169 stop:2356 length:1188 start_codon:yes stop_codon:yes gene_type:complete
MSGQTGSIDDDPYVFIKKGQQAVGDPTAVDFVNPVRAFFDGMADFIKTKDTEGTKSNEGNTAFIMGQGAGELVESTAGPNPALAIGAGEAQASAPTDSLQGADGYNTFVQLIVDKSEGMNAPAGTWMGMTLSKWDLARTLAAIMVSQAKNCEAHFAIYSFNSSGYVEWAGPSDKHDECIEWLLSSNSTAFVPGGDACQGAGMALAIEGMRGGIIGADGKSTRIDRAVTISFSDTCYDWARQHWMTKDEGDTYKPLDMWLREKGPVFYVGMGAFGMADQTIPYYGGVMRNSGGGNDYGSSDYRARAGTGISDWVYFPGTMRLQAEDCYSKQAGLSLPQKSGGSGRPTIPKWPHEGVDMQQFFKAVLMAPDRGDAMIHLAGTFGDLVRMTDPEGDYS